MTTIKYCGITNGDDGAAAAVYAHALGLVFYPPSPRAVTVESCDFLWDLPPFVQLVALMVNPSEAELQTLLSQTPIRMIQFHGDESGDFCDQMAQRYRFRYMKAFRVSAAFDFVTQAQAYRYASGFLLDAYHPDQYGGTGQSFDWGALWPSVDQGKAVNKPLVLAGGLNADNVANAIGLIQRHPERYYPLYGVDVSGGIEQQKGMKSRDKMQRFALAVQSCR